jgi:hypothetical protein
MITVTMQKRTKKDVAFLRMSWIECMMDDEEKEKKQPIHSILQNAEH